jgi:hypothetical protein
LQSFSGEVAFKLETCDVLLIEGEEAPENNPAGRVGMLHATEDAMVENR